MRKYRTPKGSLNNIQPLGQCDFTQYLCNHKDLRWYMEYNSTGLYNTGLLVHKDFLFKPNPSNLLPQLHTDPTPVKNARPCWYFPGD